MPFTAFAQSHVRFSVVPGDDSGLVGVGSVQTDFRFVADVTNAKCYELNYDDNAIDSGLLPDSQGRAVRSHRYDAPGRYWAVMKAWRLREGDADREVDCQRNLDELAEPIELRLRIVVRPAAALAPAPAAVAIFSAAPSDPDDPGVDGNPPTWADFTFRAYVSGAASYELNFDDGVVDTGRTPASAGGAVLWRHRYDEPGVYTATMTARRSSGEPIELRQRIEVTAPAAAVPLQWPPPRPMAAPPAARADPGILPWLLLAGVLIATALSRLWFWGQTDTVAFGATQRQGQYAVDASTDAADAVSIRVRSHAPQFSISKNAKKRRVRPGSIKDNS